MVRPYRSSELQAFRGIAALVVLLWHCSQYFALTRGHAALFNAAFDAASSVISFFVLSGFVLALSQLERPIRAEEIGIFYLRRAFRIYPALWLAVAVATAYEIAVAGRVWSPAVSPQWSAARSASTFAIRPLIETLLGKATELPLPVWTLNIELFGSLVMPGLIWMLIRRPLWLIPTAILLLVVRLLAGDRFDNIPVFLLAFVIGVGTVRLIEPIRSRLTGDMPVRLLAVAGLLTMCVVRARIASLVDAPYSAASVVTGSIGAAAIIAAIYARPQAFALLAHRSLAWLGEISYSLYLLHMPIMGFIGLAIAQFYGARLGSHVLPAVGMLMLGTGCVTMLAASASYWWLERPANEAGKSFVRSLHQRRWRMPALGA